MRESFSKKNIWILAVLLIVIMIPVQSVTIASSVQSNSPVADFNVSPSHPIIWDIITFTDISTDPDNDIVARTWDIDGHTHTTIVAQCAFLKPGNYSAKLLVTDSEGNTDTIEKTIRIYNPPLGNNIILTFNVTDQRDNPLCCTDIYVYGENSSLVAFAVTNNTGEASVTVPPGSYKINVSHNGISDSKDMSFSSDERVCFTLMISDDEPPATFNWWFAIAPSITITIGLLGVIIWKRKHPVQS